MRYAMIMAGGAGTRLWPLSRRDRPKQIVPMIDTTEGRRSLLQISAARLEGLVAPERVFVCANEAYRDEVLDALEWLAPARFLGEPVGRDTVNAVGFGAAVLERQDPEAVFAVVTADQIIEPVDIFRERMDLAMRLVEQDASRMVTFSITPTFPATGYGYVERGAAIEGAGGLAHEVERFVEKPDEATARAYLEAGTFGWNSGMFVWSAATLMRAMERLLPASHAGLQRIGRAWGSADEGAVVREVYPSLEKISVDYALMEPISRERGAGTAAERICAVTMDLSWMDVGSWATLAQTMAPGEGGCRVSGRAEVLDCTDTTVFNETDDHLVAVMGCEGMVVVRTPDATLVMPASCAERLKELHALVPESLR